MKYKQLPLICLIASSVLLTGCMSNGSKTSNSAQSSASSQQGDLRQVIADDKQIAVPVFRVNFMKKFSAHARQESGSWTSSASVTSTAVVKTVGFKESVLQDITNQAYDDLISRLKKKKFNVMSISDAASKSKDLVEESKNSDFPDVDDDESVYLAKSTMYPTGFTATAGGRLTKAPSLIEEIKAGMFAVNYTVDFVASKEETDRMGGWSSESLSVEISLRPAISVSGVIQSFGFAKGQALPFGGFIGPGATLSMNERAISTIEFADGKIEDTTSTGASIALGAVDLLGSLMGSKSKSSFTDYTLKVHEDKMIKATVDALKKANEQWVSKL